MMETLPTSLIAAWLMFQNNHELSGLRLTQTLHRRFVTSWWAMVTLLLPVAFLIYSISPLLSDNYLYDTWLSSQSSPPSQDILIIEIDEPSLQRLGRWPWPRDIHARLIEQLDAAGAAAVVLDLLLTEPSRESQQDVELAQAMEAYGNVHLPLVLLPERGPGAPYRDILKPLPALMSAAASVGHINTSLDSDGVVREVALKRIRKNMAWPQLMTGVAGIPAQALDTASVRIPYRGWPRHYPSVSYHDVLEGRLPVTFLRDRVVLVGMTAQGMGDRYNMSLLTNELMPGVEVHAHLLDALRNDSLIRQVSPLSGALLAGLPILLLMLLAWWLRFRYMLTIVLVLWAGSISASLVALHLGWWWPPSASLIALGLAVVVIIWRTQATLLAWFEQELKVLYREPPILPYRQESLALNEGGKLYQQLQSLEFALTRLVQGRRFVLDVMHSLPLPIFILNQNGSVLLANRQAEMLGEGVSGEGVSGEEVLGKNAQGTRPVQHIEDLPDVVSFEEERGFADLWPPSAFDTEAAPAMLTGGLCKSVTGSTYRLEMGRLSTSDTTMSGGWVVWLLDLTSEVAIEVQRASMLSFLSHDMKAPQTRALALIDAQQEPENALPEQVFYQQLEQSLKASLGMINDFIGLTRAKSFHFKHEFVLFEDLVMEVLDQVRPLACAKRIEVSSEFNDEDGAPVSGDKGYLARAVFNLIENAVKYGYPNGKVHVTVNVDAEWTTLAVADNGPGIREADTERIFDDYERSSAPGETRGHGLGLALVKTVAEKHHGTVHCTSELGKGSRFVLRLPSFPLD